MDAELDTLRVLIAIDVDADAATPPQRPPTPQPRHRARPAPSRPPASPSSRPHPPCPEPAPGKGRGPAPPSPLLPRWEPELPPSPAPRRPATASLLALVERLRLLGVVPLLRLIPIHSHHVDGLLLLHDAPTQEAGTAAGKAPAQGR